MLTAYRALRPHSILVRELHAGHRENVREHLQELSEQDRSLRFGMPTTDDIINKYVDKLNFSVDSMFGVFNQELKLIGFAHLAYPSKSKSKPVMVEFGVSVSQSGRGQGVGSALFKRAAMHARNTHVEILYVHCLSSNKVMMHIAKKAGMNVEFSYGEADAYLRLPKPTSASIVKEAVEAQVAAMDYAVKRNLKESNFVMAPVWPFVSANK